MKSNLPCEVVRDLFPSYIDGLTSEKTNELIEEHIEECNGCRSVLMEMKAEVVEENKVSEEDKKEIDFLKKARSETRKETIKVFCQWAVSFLLIVTVWFVAKWYFIGFYLSGGDLDCEVQVRENQVLVEASLDEEDNRVISKVEYEERDGGVYLAFKVVFKSPFREETVCRSGYEASEPIEKVAVGSRIYWYKGTPITKIASKVYGTCHDYVGDMSANGETTRALNMGEVLGSFKNELQTSVEPYGWKMILENEIVEEEQKAKKRIMEAYAYILLAAVGNLSEVSYEYSVDGQIKQLTITQVEANEFAGHDIKECGENILLFQELMEDAKVYGRLYSAVLE